jgi:DNA replication protein DnaC
MGKLQSQLLPTKARKIGWSELLGDQALTTAVLDRILNKCEIISFFNDDSYRIKHQKTIFEA